MELSEFSIKDVVLGFSSDSGELALNILPKSFEWVELSIDRNNDFELGPVLKKNREIKVISTISSLSDYETLLGYHLKWLNRESLDILLVDSRGSWNDDDLLRLWTDQNGYYKSFGLANVESKSDIERALSVGVKPEWVSMVLNPTYFNLELLEFLKENKIKIISHEVLGGSKMAKTNIEIYTLQFLLGFAALYSDMVCLSSHSAEEAIMDKTVLMSFTGQGITDEIKSVYVFSSSRMVKRSPHKKLPLYQYFVSSLGDIFKYTGPRDIQLTSLSLEEDLEKIDEESMSELEIFVKEGIEKLVLPSDCIPGSGESEAFWRYNIISMLTTRRDYKKYKYTYMKNGNMFFVVRQKKSWLPWRKRKIDAYILTYKSDLSEFIFKKISDTPEKG